MRTLTPEDIKRENAYRAAQRKAGKSRKSNIKDPNAPKKPLSAYFMFLQRIRANPRLVQEIFGDETETTKQSVLAAAKWRSMTDAERQVCGSLCLCLFLYAVADKLFCFCRIPFARPCVLLLFIVPLFCESSHFWRRPNRRKWSTKLREGCMRKVLPPMEQASTSVFCRTALPLRTSRWSRRRARATSARTTGTDLSAPDFPPPIFSHARAELFLLIPVCFA